MTIWMSRGRMKAVQKRVKRRLEEKRGMVGRRMVEEKGREEKRM